jgi:hypothetical protein
VQEFAAVQRSCAALVGRTLAHELMHVFVQTGFPVALILMQCQAVPVTPAVRSAGVAAVENQASPLPRL